MYHIIVIHFCISTGRKKIAINDESIYFNNKTNNFCMAKFFDWNWSTFCIKIINCNTIDNIRCYEFSLYIFQRNTQ